MALPLQIFPLGFDLASLHNLKVKTWEVTSRKKIFLGHSTPSIHHPNGGSYIFSDFSVSQIGTAMIGLDNKYLPEEETCVLFSSSFHMKPK